MLKIITMFIILFTVMTVFIVLYFTSHNDSLVNNNSIVKSWALTNDQKLNNKPHTDLFVNDLELIYDNKDLSEIQHYYHALHIPTQNKVKDNLCQEHIFVLNLNRSTNRKLNITEQAQKYKINNLEIVEAVDGKQFDKSTDGMFTFQNNDNLQYKTDVKKDKYLVACTLSHINTIRKFHESKLPHAIIMEDDISFLMVPHWYRNINTIVNEAPPDWEMLSLFTMCEKNNFDTGHYIDYSNSSCWSMAAYLINRKGSQRVMDEYVTVNSPSSVNVTIKGSDIISDSLIPKLLRSYAHTPQLFVPINDFGGMNSTIHENHTANHVNTVVSILEKHLTSILLRSIVEIPKILHLVNLNDTTTKEQILHEWVSFESKHPGWKIKYWDTLFDDTTDEYSTALKILHDHGGMFVHSSVKWLGNVMNIHAIRGLLNINIRNDYSVDKRWISCIPNHGYLKTLSEIYNNNKTKPSELVLPKTIPSSVNIVMHGVFCCAPEMYTNTDQSSNEELCKKYYAFVCDR
jgi:GR25 family glycosyltransferase involved in LPS biosynthesis